MSRTRKNIASVLGFALFLTVGEWAWGEPDLFSSPASQEPVISNFRETILLLGTVAFVEAEFSESKEMSLLSEPLLSKGRFLFSANEGLYRKMEHPFALEILINRNEFIQRDATGEVTRIPIKKIPQAKIFSDLFFSIVGGDERGFEKYFDVFFVGRKDHWQMGFKSKPKSPIARGLQHIVISGEGPRFTLVETVEKNGDRTTTRYSHQRIYLKDARELLKPPPFPELGPTP